MKIEIDKPNVIEYVDIVGLMNESSSRFRTELDLLSLPNVSSNDIAGLQTDLGIWSGLFTSKDGYDYNKAHNNIIKRIGKVLKFAFSTGTLQNDKEGNLTGRISNSKQEAMLTKHIVTLKTDFELFKSRYENKDFKYTVENTKVPVIPGYNGPIEDVIDKLKDSAHIVTKLETVMKVFIDTVDNMVNAKKSEAKKYLPDPSTVKNLKGHVNKVKNNVESILSSNDKRDTRIIKDLVKSIKPDDLINTGLNLTKVGDDINLYNNSKHKEISKDATDAAKLLVNNIIEKNKLNLSEDELGVCKEYVAVIADYVTLVGTIKYLYIITLDILGGVIDTYTVVSRKQSWFGKVLNFMNDIDKTLLNNLHNVNTKLLDLFDMSDAD